MVEVPSDRSKWPKFQVTVPSAGHPGLTVETIPKEQIRKKVQDELDFARSKDSDADENWALEEQFKHSKLSGILNRMENMFDREDDTRWRAIKRTSHDLIDQNPTAEGAHQIIQDRVRK